MRAIVMQFDKVQRCFLELNIGQFLGLFKLLKAIQETHQLVIVHFWAIFFFFNAYELCRQIQRSIDKQKRCRSKTVYLDLGSGDLRPFWNLDGECANWCEEEEEDVKFVIPYGIIMDPEVRGAGLLDVEEDWACVPTALGLATSTMHVAPSIDMVLLNWWINVSMTFLDVHV